MRVTKLLAGLALVTGAGYAPIAATIPAALAQDAMHQVGLVRTGSGTFSIDVEGADIRAVLRAIAEFSGRNIVLGKDVEGRVKVTLHNVGWEEALRTILRSQGLEYVEEGGIIRVDSASKLQAEEVDRETARSKAAELMPLETRIVKLNFANAGELNSSLNGSLTRRGQILVEKRTNSLIISDVPENVARVEKMALSLDSVTPQIEITAKLVDVDEAALRDLGIQWNLGEPSQFFTGGAAATAHAPQPGPGQAVAGDQNSPATNPTTRLSYGIFRSWGSLEAQLSAMEQNRKAKIISNPRITTFDNREAKILVGQKIPLIVQDVAGNPVSQLQTIGIQLKVTPHLTAEKKIVMDLHPEVSDLSTQSTVQGGVIINTSEADTRVMVDDGQTAVIGGLIRADDGTVRTGVPILKDIPLIGNLFRDNSVAHENRELIIFVTPRVVTDMASVR